MAELSQTSPRRLILQTMPLSANKFWHCSLVYWFTGSAFTGMLTRHRIRISMDRRGCWRDNVFVERLWRSVKYEEVYLHAYEGVSAARAGLGKYFLFYNSRRSHTALDCQTPDHVYFKSISTLPLARQSVD